MKLRKTMALLVVAATVAGCASPQTVTRSQFNPSQIDPLATAKLTGAYR